jgi:CCR4-NOT complex subunit CAF16
MTLPKGGRVLLVGANGAGKTTLMSVIGGKHMVDEAAVRVLGRPAFHDTSLSAEVSLLTGNWTQTVNFVGHNVPYQAMEVSTLIASHSIGVDPSRRDRLVKLLEVNPKWNLTTVSDGQRRRVQILCKLLKPCSVLLLDEITTDLDLLARQDLLAFLREESEERGVTIMYCTHIFDGLDGWASHIAYVIKGQLKLCKPVEAISDLLEVPEEQRARGWGTLFCAVQRWLLAQWPSFIKVLQPPTTEPIAMSDEGPAVVVRNLTWGYTSAAKVALPNLSFDIPRGCRCILVGANGAGKTTLLRLLGSKHMVPEGQISVLGKSAFHDLALNTSVSLLSGDWTRTIASVGGGVPFQADFSVGYMADQFVAALVRDGMDRALVESRKQRLVTLLDMDLNWRLHQVSDGQRRRAQLLLKLLRPSQMLLMDEVTTDLDVISRQALLQFLREECDQRGATVIYSTHIFDGLDDWPTYMLHLQEGAVKYVGPIADAPKPSSGPRSGASSGSLFHQVRSYLEDERAARIAQKQAESEATVMQISETPSTVQVQAAPPPAPVKAAGKFDRFGGGSRQGMYR